MTYGLSVLSRSQRNWLTLHAIPERKMCTIMSHFKGRSRYSFSEGCHKAHKSVEFWPA